MERAGHDPLTADRAPAQQSAREGTQPGGAAPRQTTAAGNRQPGKPWRRLRHVHPAVGQFILLLCFLAAGVAVTWPRATYLAGQLPSSRDSASYVWGFWWVARQVSHLGNPWFTHYMAAPVGVSLGYHSLMVLPGLIFTPVTLLFGPSASYNLLVILVPGLSSYAMYRAARLWLRSQTGAIAAGAAFGLSAMLSQEDWYHINIAVGALFLPVTLELAVRLRRSPGVRQAVLLGVGLGAAVLTDSESAVLAAILTLCVLLPWVLRRPSRARLWPAALAALVTAVVATPQLVSMAQETARGGLAINPALLAVTDKLYGIGLPGMFAPSPRVADFGLTGLAQPFIHSRNNENLPMFGVTVTALALFGLVVAWRRRNTKWLALLWVVCCALALGGSLWVGKHQYVPFAQDWNGVTVSPVMPYTWFVRIPGLSSFREADRLAILGLVPAALLAGAAVDWMRYHARPLIAVVVALGVLETGYSGNPRVGEMPTALPRLDAPIAAQSHQVHRGGRAVRAARRHSGGGREIRRRGAGAGHRRRAPAGHRLCLPAAAAHHQRDVPAGILWIPRARPALHAAGPLRPAHARGEAPAVQPDTRLVHPAHRGPGGRGPPERTAAEYWLGAALVQESRASPIS